MMTAVLCTPLPSRPVQWKGEVSKGLPELTPEERLHAAEEMSDVLLYLVRVWGGVG